MPVTVVRTTTKLMNAFDATKVFKAYKKQFLSQNFWERETACYFYVNQF